MEASLEKLVPAVFCPVCRCVSQLHQTLQMFFVRNRFAIISVGSDCASAVCLK